MAIMRTGNYWTDKQKFKKTGQETRQTYGPESFKDKPLGKNSYKVSDMGPGSMGPPPKHKQGFIDNQNLLPPRPGVPSTGGIQQRPMPALPPKEIEKRLKKLETGTVSTTQTVVVKDDQYILGQETIYVAYASALANLVSSKITNQSDATDFQYGPFNPNGVLLAFRGFFKSNSIYQSGDPTDYSWESTSGLAGFGASERATTTSTGLKSSLGNPTKPGSGVTWTTVNPGSSIAANSVWLAERFTIGNVISDWSIEPVGAYISSGKLVDSAVIAAKIANSAITTAKILNDAIDNDKIAANAVNNDSIAANAITANEIQAGSIGVQQLAANSVTANAIAANSVTASEIAAGTITATQIAADAITANAIATNAVTADAITAGTITADEIASNAITSAKVNADAITVNKIDLDGQLNVTANNGAILWGKSGATDTTNTGLFLGRDGSGNPRIVFGNASSFINFDGTDVSLVNCDVDNNAGTSAVIITNTTNTTTYSIGPNIQTINIQLSGGGGGGGGPEAVDGNGPGIAGGASSVVVKKADGTTRTGNGALTITAAGGAAGGWSGAGTGVGYPGSSGGSFSHGSATEPPFTDAAGGTPTGSSGSANGAIPSGGGGGHTNNNQDNQSGGGGGAGAYSSTTYTVVDTTDSLLVTVGAGGAGDSTVRDGSAGSGARGVVRLQGAQ